MALLPVRRVDRLLASTVAASTLVVMAVLIGFDILLALVEEFEDIGEGDYTLVKALVYVAYTVPRRIHENFAYCALIGTLVGLGLLASQGELTALRAAGLAKRRIALAAVATVAAMTLAVTALGESLAPQGERWAQALALQAKNRDYALSGLGLWARDADTVVNAKRVLSDAGRLEMREVRLFAFEPGGRLAEVTRAGRAVHEEGQWRLDEVQRFRFHDDRVESQALASDAWQSSLDPAVLGQGAIRARYLDLASLWESWQYRKANRLHTQDIEAAFWMRLFSPLTTLALVFAVTPFAFGALRSGGFGKRLFLGIVIAVSFYFLQRALINLADVYGYSLPLVNALPLLLLGLAGWVYYRRHP
ncbi:MAG: LPS export ABC transporter permease LptG [Pseudoxanthomonas sp.]|nr:LPS export ABC transporter permease LptG [Pseudoxanthomonas sp.]